MSNFIFLIFVMAYFSSWGKRSYSRRGYSGYNWKRRRLTPTRAFKRSASNMTQNGLFNVNCVVPVVLNPASMLSGGQASGYMGAFSVLDVPGTIYTSAMHAALKKVFDQYRVEKVTVKIGMGANAGNIPIGTMFTCIDRTGFDETAQMDLATIRSYGSYKEKQTSGDGSAVSPLVVNIAQTDVVGLSLYRDTYSNVTFPKVLVGWHAYTNTQLNAVQLQIEIDAAVRYRGVRLSNKA